LGNATVLQYATTEDRSIVNDSKHRLCIRLCRRSGVVQRLWTQAC